MKVVSLIENNRLPHRQDLHAEPGLALGIFSESRRILFDTGISGAFASNARKLDVDLAEMDLAVISHHHFDHGGGLAAFLEANNRAQVYLRRSETERFYLKLFGPFKRPIGLDENLIQRNIQRFSFIDQLTEIAEGVFVLTRIGRQHPTPKGNRHLLKSSGTSNKPDDFEHELILVVRENGALTVFTGCSHHGILNMLDAVVEHFPGQPIKALFGGFHLIDHPLIYNMALSPAEIRELGRAILNYSIEKVYTGHCTGKKAYPFLREAMGERLETMTTGFQVEL